MESVVVDSELFSLLVNFAPRVHIHGGVSGEREYASIVFTAEECLLAIDYELRTLGMEIAHAESSI